MFVRCHSSIQSPHEAETMAAIAVTVITFQSVRVTRVVVSFPACITVVSYCSILCIYHTHLMAVSVAPLNDRQGVCDSSYSVGWCGWLLFAPNTAVLEAWFSHSPQLVCGFKSA